MRSIALFICGYFLFLTRVGGAQEAVFGPKTKAITRQVMVAYNRLPALHEKISLRFEVNPEGAVPPPHGNMQFEIRMQRPNKFWISGEETVSNGKTRRMMAVCDGTNIWFWHSDHNTYRKGHAPDTIVYARMNDLSQLTPEYDILFMDANPFSDPYPSPAFSLGEPDKVDTVDVIVINGKLSEDMAFTKTWRYLIGRKDHLFRGMVIRESGRDPHLKKTVSMTETVTYQLIDTTPNFTAADFTFTPPPGTGPDKENSVN